MAETRIATRGRPRRSMYERIFGARPWSARAARVRELPKTAELPTEMTATRMTLFIIDGRMSMPAFSIAMTKGEAVALTVLMPVLGSRSLL